MTALYYRDPGLPSPEGDNVIEFRLLYEGNLPSQSPGNGRVREKHHIRKQVHKQLRVLWETEAPLIGRSGKNERENAREPKRASWAETQAATNSYHGWSFVPLICPDLFLTCVLDIVFLRVEKRDYVIESGDLDNRLKVLGDALKMPSLQDAKVLNEKGIVPEADEVPMYCLLGDDKLISEIKVSAGQLLMLPSSPTPDPNHVYLQMHVKAKLTRMVLGNMDLA